MNSSYCLSPFKWLAFTAFCGNEFHSLIVCCVKKYFLYNPLSDDFDNTISFGEDDYNIECCFLQFINIIVPVCFIIVSKAYNQ